MAEMVRTNPFEDFMTLREAMNQMLLDSVVRNRTQGAPEAAALDLYETEQAYVAKLAVPGLKPANFEITLHDNTLRVRGQTAEQQLEEKAHYHIREHRFGAFERVVRFGSTVDGDNVEASLAEGILTIRVPKSEAAKPKRITVNMG
ncbi:MAG: Hsp20/alpha crystallin family protein [Chloroflexaceae bacterium]|nr:Hsp20/alpha crystallin family protein [Chloroflexaceae bacterium]